MAADWPDSPGATVFTVSDTFIFPGFIDAHNHVAYNVVQTGRRRGTIRIAGSGRQASSAYAAFKAPYATLKDQKKLFCEMVTRGEIAALISGDHHRPGDRAEPNLLQGPRPKHREPE